MKPETTIARFWRQRGQLTLQASELLWIASIQRGFMSAKGYGSTMAEACQNDMNNARVE